MWITFGAGKNFIHIHITGDTIPIFDGCHQCHHFWGGERSAWEVESRIKILTQAFLHAAARYPHTTLKLRIIILYDGPTV